MFKYFYVFKSNCLRTHFFSPSGYKIGRVRVEDFSFDVQAKSRIKGCELAWKDGLVVKSTWLTTPVTPAPGA